MDCTVMIWRSWVRTPVGLNLGCVALLPQVVLEPKLYMRFTISWTWSLFSNYYMHAWNLTQVLNGMRSRFSDLYWHLISARTFFIMYENNLLCWQITRANFRLHVKWVVNLVIAYGHFTLGGLCGSVWINIKYFITPKSTKNAKFCRLCFT